MIDSDASGPSPDPQTSEGRFYEKMLLYAFAIVSALQTGCGTNPSVERGSSVSEYGKTEVSDFRASFGKNCSDTELDNKKNPQLPKLCVTGAKLTIKAVEDAKAEIEKVEGRYLNDTGDGFDWADLTKGLDPKDPKSESYTRRPLFDR